MVDMVIFVSFSLTSHLHTGEYVHGKTTDPAIPIHLPRFTLKMVSMENSSCHRPKIRH